jgi:hypothetical protein
MRNIRKISFIIFLSLVFSTAAYGFTTLAYASNNNSEERIYIEDGDGAYFICNSKAFDPMIASDDELAQYCIDPRPTDPVKLKEWIKDVNGINFVKPSLKLDKNIPKSYSNVYSTNWAGYVKTPSGYGINTTMMDFQLPFISEYNGGGECATWTGLGGYYANDTLVQAGWTGRVGGYSTMFYEVIGTNLPSGVVAIASDKLPAIPGHNYRIYVNYHDAIIAFGMRDLTTNTVLLPIVSLPINWITGNPQTSAEYIVERPPGDGADLALFRDTNYNDEIHMWNNKFTPNNGQSTDLTDSLDVNKLTLIHSFVWPFDWNLAHCGEFNPSGTNPSSFLTYWDSYS